MKDKYHADEGTHARVLARATIKDMIEVSTDEGKKR